MRNSLVMLGEKVWNSVSVTRYELAGFVWKNTGRAAAVSIEPERFKTKRARRLSLSEMVASNAPTPASLLVNAGALKLIWPICTALAPAACWPRLRLPGPTSGYAPLGVIPTGAAVGAVPRYCLSSLRLVWLMPESPPMVAQPAVVGANSAPGVELRPIGLY